MLRVNRRALLEFFDHSSPTSGFHSSAINGVIGEDLGLGLLTHYFEGQGIQAVLEGYSATTGTKKGRRLDGWILVDARGERSRYQVEIKNWNAHSLGGRSLSCEATVELAGQYMRDRWVEEWDATARRFTNLAVDKVLTRMISPAPVLPVKPLVAFWFAIHPTGQNEPFFEVPCKGDFSSVCVYSMSTYLRSLTDEWIAIAAPRAEARLDILSRLTSTAPVR